MNIPFSSDRRVDVRVWLTFTDQNSFEADLRLDGGENVVFTVVGRTPQDVVSMELEYDGCRFGYPIEMDSTGSHLKKISIYGGRDYWSQLLRNKAMESDDEGS